MNLIVLIGRLTSNPELKYTQAGKALVKFTIAVNRRFSKDEADFINVVAWEKKAELVNQYLKKGSLVGVSGELRIRSYEDENKAKKKMTEVLAENIEFLDSKKEKASETEEISSFNTKDTLQDDDFPF